MKSSLNRDSSIIIRRIIMRKISKHAFLFVAVFSFGYMVNDVVEEIGVNIIDEVSADVAGMGYSALKQDRAFRKAVRYLVEGCDVTGYVDDGYMYGGSIDC
jgi:hypothetical protein